MRSPALALPGSKIVPGGIAVLFVVGTFVGFDVIPQSAEEVDLPYRTLGLLLIISVVMATLYHVVVIVGVGAGLPRGEAGEVELASAADMAGLWAVTCSPRSWCSAGSRGS